jgi:hypothetical protein
MSDFDAALERLVSDPQFRDALAADPARALAGYRLSEDEWDLLRSQIDTGTGGEREVEQRTSKASLFGLLNPLGGTGIGSGVGDALQGGGGSGAGSIGGSMGGYTPPAPLYGGAGPDAGASFGGADAAGASFGTEPPSGEGFGSAFSRSAFGEPVGGGASGADAGGEAGAGGEPDRGYQPRHGSAGDGIGATLGDFAGGSGEARGTLYGSPPEDYHTRVDANGDGRWDQFTAVDRGDRGVDLVVDRDGDGRAEFVGHDFDRDGLIDEASTDTDGDGRLDARWVDDNGDGWLDRRTAQPPSP